MSVYTRMVNLEVMVNIFGQTVQFTKVSSRTDLDMDLGFGLEEMVFQKNTKEISKMTRKMVKGYLPGLMETYIKAATKMILERDLVLCSGMMEHFTKDCGKMGFKMAHKNQYRFIK